MSQKLTLSEYLFKANSLLILAGAGLSAPSGLPTFRNEHKFWKGRRTSSMAERSTFMEDPCVVWLYHEMLRKLARQAMPNAGHYALARMMALNPNALMITQNIDGLLSLNVC